jgi:hypothetical protein
MLAGTDSCATGGWRSASATPRSVAIGLRGPRVSGLGSRVSGRAQVSTAQVYRSSQETTRRDSFFYPWISASGMRSAAHQTKGSDPNGANLRNALLNISDLRRREHKRGGDPNAVPGGFGARNRLQ